MKKILLFVGAVMLCLTAGAQDWRRIRGNTSADKAFKNITGTGTYGKTFKLAKGKHYLFSVDVTSPHELYFTFNPMGNGIKKISYNTPGRKQKLVGLLYSGNGAPIRGEMVIVSQGRKGKTTLGSFQLKEIDVKFTPALKPYSTATTLGRSSVIIIPSDPKVRAQYLELGKKISAKFGNIPVIDDKAACVKDAPMLKPGYANCNLVIIGNLNNNRAFWPAYTRKLAASDAFFPGGKGYEVRTAVNVLSNGKNHIIIGGSTDEGIARGVEKFLAKCTSATIPYLTEVELDGECAKRVDADIADWQKNFPRGGFPGTSPGYDAVRRWYHHALMYYWTGKKFYADWARKFFVPVLKQKAYTHHYIMEWLFMTWEVTRNCGLYSEAEKRGMEELLLYNYVELQVGADMYWARHLTPPYTRLYIGSRHVTSPLWCNLMASDYLFRNYKLNGDFAALVKFTRDEHVNAADSIARYRSRPDADFEGGDNYVEQGVSVYRYAFKFNKFDIFRNKQAVKWANLQLFVNSERDSVLFGGYGEHKLPAAILGSYYRDPVYKYYEEKGRGSKWGRGMFIDRYPCGISAYNNDLKAVLPRRDFTVQTMPYNAIDLNRSVYVKNIRKKYPELKKMTPVVAAVLRSGWNDDFNVLGISGSSEIVRAGIGEITSLAFYRRFYLSSSWNAIYHYNSGLPFEQNTVQVSRTKEGGNAVNERPRAGFLDWKFTLGGRQAVSMLFRDFNGTTWRRTIISHSIDQYVVYDTVTAEKDDLYDISVIWRPMGKILPSTADTLYTQNGHIFSINLSGKGFKLKTNTASYLKKESEKLLSLFSYHGNLTKGQSVNAAALLQVKKNTRIHDCGNGRLLFSEKGKVVGELTITPKGFVEITPSQIIARNVKEVKVGSNVVKIADKVTNVAWFFPTNNCYRDVAGFRKVPAAENKKVMDICRAYLASLKVPAAQSAAGAAAGYEKKATFKPVWKKNIFPAPEVYNTGWAGYRVIDVGRVAEVCYIRSLTAGVAMPAWMEYSVNGKDFKRIDLKAAKWNPGIWTHNYGNIQLRDKWFTDIRLSKPVKGRYFRFASRFRPQFHFSDRLMPYRPVKILAAEPFVLVSNEVVKIYPRGYQWDNTIFGAFDHKGNELFVKKQQQAPLDIKIMNFPAKESVATCEPDGKMRFYDKKGKELLMIDSIKAMQDFHKKWGRSNTRHPAGGFPSTYSVGAWQNNKAIVAGRYGQTGFHTADGKMTGIRAAGIYNINFLLDHGVDFNGDGKDEMLGLSNCYLIHYFGDARESAPLPNTTWPQVYDRSQSSLPLWWNISYGVWGPKFYTFKALPFAGKNGYAAGISRVYMFIYNAAARKYAWTLKFTNPVAAGDIRSVDDAMWLAAVAFDDGVVTVYEWRDPNAAPAIAAKVSIDTEVRAIAISASGRIFAAGNDGIYEISGKKIIKRIDGSFTDVKCRGNEIITASTDGTVTFWKE